MRKNHFTHAQAEALFRLYDDELAVPYKRDWMQAIARKRLLIQCRLLGATSHFVLEAMVDAVANGRGSVFFAARPQVATIQRAIAIRWAKMVGVELTGDQLWITSDRHAGIGAGIQFFGDEYHLADGLIGNSYVDQFCFIPDFPKVRQLVTGISAPRHLRKTYFGCAPIEQHPGWSMWRDELAGPGEFRLTTTIEDAVAAGVDLFDLDELRAEYGEAEFAAMFMCEGPAR